MIHIVLYQPEIPPNTGNIMRLCANTGARLHLIEPLGFNLDDRQLRRAGLDYHEFAATNTYPGLDDFIATVEPARLLAVSTRASTRHTDVEYRRHDALIFGPETRGLPQALLDRLPPEHCIRLPMVEGSRSLNLSNTVAVVVYEAWRQLGFSGGN